jgi:hypothetical protein
MGIVKFGDFAINESAKPTILDCVIDNDGLLYDGKEGRPLIKGNVEWRGNKIRRIVSNSGEYYAAGIDSSGTLYSVFHDELGIYRINFINNRVVRDVNQPEPIRSEEDNVWKDGDNYYHFVPIIPTGWVNVKIDMEVIKRVRRYSSSLGNTGNDNSAAFTIFRNKLKEFVKISGEQNVALGKTRRTTKTIQKDMAVIMLLHYLNEIKDFFTPSSAGFLFESFISGLIPRSIIVGDNGIADVRADELDYQIKLYKDKGNVDIIKREVTTIDENGDKIVTRYFLDYYVIAFKSVNKVDIFIFNKREIEDYITRGVDYYEDTAEVNTVGRGLGNQKLKTSLNLSLINLNKVALKTSNNYFELHLNNIEGRIDNIAKGLKNSLDNLYSGLSKFQYNIETIITGIDEDGNLLDGQEFSGHYNSAISNLNYMNVELTTLKQIIKI